MLPQHWGLNRGEGSTWKFEIEEKLADHLRAGDDVWLKVRPVYKQDPATEVERIRPEAYAVEYRIKNETENRTVRHYLYNTHDGNKVAVARKATSKDLRAPKPNDVIQVGRLTYYTDDLGRVTRVKGRLELDKQRDSYYYRRKIKRRGNEGDEGAHLIDRRFGGVSKPINLVPLDKSLNRAARSEWNQIEQKIENALEQGRTVEVDYHVRYGEGDSFRPDEILLAYGLDKASFQKTIDNEPIQD